ncbi:MAG: TetR/AcrR family transcriptional regulator, partial [Actinobacteria bacterium]|nr:TetR/AcrR family transcriptional regulator [Actinomycetota bacterium]
MTDTVGKAGAVARADRGGTRDRILLEASRLFARWGYHSTSTRDIAGRVGIRQPSLFHHFASKQAIMEELLVLNFEHAVRAARAVMTWEGSAPARLYLLLRA